MADTKQGWEDQSMWHEAWEITVRLFAPPLKALLVCLGAQFTAYWLGAPVGLRSMVMAAAGLFLLDTLLGGVLAIRDKRFSSRCFGRSVTKFLVYGSALLTGILLGVGMQLGYAVTVIVVTLIFTREGISTLENLRTLGFNIPGVKSRLEAQAAACKLEEQKPDVSDGV